MSQQLTPTIPAIHPNVISVSGGCSVRQLKFVDRYLETGNATESARYAGYAGDNDALAVAGHQILRSPKVKLELQRRLGTSIAGSNEVLELLSKHARADLTDVLDNSGNFDFKAAKRRRLLKKLKIKTRYEKDSEGNLQPITEHEYEIHDPQAALEKLGKFHGLFIERSETVNINLNLDRGDLSSFLDSTLSDVIDVTPEPSTP